jgi:hypothetical protein
LNQTGKKNCKVRQTRAPDKTLVPEPLNFKRTGPYPHFIIKRGRFGHIFQGRYKAILVDIDEYAKELSGYIHLIPVRANMVETLEEYE